MNFSAGTYFPRKRAGGPMSRWVSMYQAFANACWKAPGFSWKRFEIARYEGSAFRARSLVSIIGACRRFGSCASGTVSAAAPPGAVGLPEGVPSGDQGHRLLVVHRHPSKGV